jgi:tetratricopeptide (TPR) repeat protein
MKKTNLQLASFLAILVIIGSMNLVTAENQDIQSLMRNGSSLLYGGNFEESMPFFDQVLKIQPNNTNALNDKGVALGGQGEYDQAISYFDRVLKIDPKNVHALNNKAAALVRIGKYDEAMSVVNQVLQIDPKNVVAHSNKEAILNNNTLTLQEANSEGLSVFWNLQLFNSEGQLVGYLEPNKIVIPNLSLLNAVLDTDTTLNRTIIEKDGKKYEKIIIPNNPSYSGIDLQVTKTGFEKEGQWLFYAYHNGYILSDGDIAMEKWIIVRPLK